MNCPACKTGILETVTDMKPPTRKVCAQCHGTWISSKQYWAWLDAHGKNLPEVSKQDVAGLPVEDNRSAKLCCDCGRLMTRRLVGRGETFHLDRCSHCGGFWFDQNEWETLVSRNLHDDAHFIFTTAWQHQLAEERAREVYETRIQEILGADDFDKVKELQLWIDQHQHRSTIMAYLSNLDVSPGS